MKTSEPRVALRVAMVGPFGLTPKATMHARALPAARALAARGHDVLVAMPPWHTPTDGGRCWTDAGVSVAYCGVGILKVPGFGHAAVGARLASTAAAWRPDVVHLFKPKAYAGIAADVLRAGRVFGGGPAIVQDTDDWEGTGGWNDLQPYTALQRAFFAFQERWGLARADAVTTASLALASRIGRRKSVYYLPNALDEASFASLGTAAAARGLHPPSEPTLMLYSRFFEFPIEQVLEVFGYVRTRVPRARLVVAGKGLFGEEDRLMRAVADLGLGDAVEYVGWVEANDLPALLSRADAAIYPFSDTLINRTKSPVKLLELMAAGLPVVSEAVGEPTSIIQDGVSGRVVPAGVVAAFAEATAGLLLDTAGRARMGAAARERIGSGFLWGGQAPQLESIYEWTIQARAGVVRWGAP